MSERTATAGVSAAELGGVRGDAASDDGLLLSARGLVAGYGGAPILRGASLEISERDVGVIVGPNGAGKSTALKAIFGLVKITEGVVRLSGQEVTNRAPEAMVTSGAAFVPQERNVFPTLTVEENLEMGAFQQPEAIETALPEIYRLFPILEEKRRQPAGELSGGQRQMVAIGRALMMSPRLLLLDEPTAGLSPKVMGEIFDRILAINANGVGVLMVEQNARQALAIATRGFVLASGANRYKGTGAELLADAQVAKSFLGG